MQLMAKRELSRVAMPEEILVVFASAAGVSVSAWLVSVRRIQVLHRNPCPELECKPSSRQLHNYPS